MPSGKTHDRLTLWTLPWLVGVSIALTRDGELTLIIAGGFLFSGLMFGPDLDIYSVQFKRWGKLKTIWLPYQKICRHRSIFSHGPFIGTIIRLLYLSVFLVLIAIQIVAITQLIWGFDWNWQEFVKNIFTGITGDYQREAFALFLGLELGAMSHSLSDWVVSAYKRREARRRKPKMNRRVKRKK